MVIGITGGIGSGKSVVSRVLRCNGCRVYDCDSAAKRLMSESESIRKDIIGCVGLGAYTDDGNLDKAYLASKIFNDSDLRLAVNGIVHSAVKKDIERKISELFTPFFIESAILASSGLAELCEKIWLVDAPFDVRVKRVMERDHLDEEDVLKRIETQKKESEALPKDKIVILMNDGTSPLLIKLLENIGKHNNIETLCLKKF